MTELVSLRVEMSKSFHVEELPIQKVPPMKAEAYLWFVGKVKILLSRASRTGLHLSPTVRASGVLTKSGDFTVRTV